MLDVGMIGPFGPAEIIVCALVLVVLFGGRKVAELGKGLGQGLRDLRKGFSEIEEIEKEQTEKR